MSGIQQPASEIEVVGRLSGEAHPAWKAMAPTLADILFFSLIIWLFLAGPNGWAALLSDGDTGWHIRAGDWIRENRAFPTQDFFSFTKEGQPWFAWEWGAEVLMSWLHESAGMKGVVLGLGMLIPAYLLIVFRYAMWRGGTPLIVLPMLLLASGASAIHYLARPHLFTMLFLPMSLWLIESDRRLPSGRIWWLVPLTVIWTNLHGGFLGLIACLAFVALGELLGGRLLATKRYGLVAGACLAASLINPYTYHLHGHIADYLRSDWIRNAVDEFQSPRFRSEAMLFYEVILVVALVATYRLLRRGEWADALLLVGWAHLSLGAVRHVPIFLLISIPVVAAELTAWWTEIVPAFSRRSLLRVIDGLSSDLRSGFVRNTAWMAAPVLMLAATGRPIRWPESFPEEKFPISLIEQHRESIAGKRVLATDEWGDYLTYRFYPQQRVFFDGRSDFFGESFGKDYLAMMSGGADGEKKFDHYRFDTVLVPPEWPIQSTLRRRLEWKVVTETSKAVLLQRVELPEKPF